MHDVNFAVHATWLQQHTAGMSASLSDDLVIADSGLDCDTFNIVCRARVADVASAVRRVRAQFGDRAFSWWAGPGDLPPSLGDGLVAEGLERAESELAMRADLQHIDIPARACRVQRVRTAAELAAFAHITAANWTPPDPNVIAFYARAAHAILDPRCPLRFYLGYVDDEPVATCEITISGDIAGVYNVATLVAHRGRGIGSTMVALPLVDARNEGATCAFLQAASGAESIYRRIGFEAHGTFTEYKPASRNVSISALANSLT